MGDAEPGRERKAAKSQRHIAILLLLAGFSLVACHRPNASMPSLRVPGPATNITAIRGGPEVWLTWTMPERTTDGHRIKDNMIVVVCRRDGAAANCDSAGDPILLAPNAAGTFSEVLPTSLSSGPPRPLFYYLELKNHDGKSAGPGNKVVTLAGAPPPPLQKLKAEIQGNTVALQWLSNESDRETAGTFVRVFRTRVAQQSSHGRQGEAPAPETAAQQEISFEVPASSEQAVDTNVRSDETYEYRAQRVIRFNVEGRTRELAGYLSASVTPSATEDRPGQSVKK